MSLLSFFGLSTPGPEADFWYRDISPRTSSGVTVTEHTALNYSVCWAATRLLAGTAGWLPFNLYRWRGSGGADIDFKHRVHRLIHDAPNDDMGSMMFRARGVNQQVNAGNCFAEIVRTRDQRAWELHPIHSSRIPKNNIKRENGKLVYYVNNPEGGMPTRIAAEDMFHVPSVISDDGIFGKGVVTNAREAIGKAMATQQSGASVLRNGGVPPLALKGGKFKDKSQMEDYRRQMNATHGGPENAGKWLLLPPDSEVEKLGFSMDDSQFIESQNFDIEEIARWYGVPAHLVGHLLNANFSSIEELGIAFVKYSLLQWLKLWEMEVWRKLLTPAEQQTHYAKFNVDALERGSKQTRTEANVKEFFNGLLTLNQWAEREDMNPIDATAVIDGKQVDLGDMHFVQQAMVPLEIAARGPVTPRNDKAKPPNPPNRDDSRMRRRFGKLQAIVTTAVSSNVDAIASLTATVQSSSEATQANFTALAAVVSAIGEAGERRHAELAARMDGQQAEIAAQSERMERLATGLSEAAATANERHNASQQQMETFGGQLEQTGAAVGTIGERLDAQDGKLDSLTGTVSNMAQANLRDNWLRMLSVEINEWKRDAEKPAQFLTRLERFYEKHQTTLASAIAPWCSMTGTDAQQAATEHVSRSKEIMLAVSEVKASELPERVAGTVADWHETRGWSSGDESRTATGQTPSETADRHSLANEALPTVVPSGSNPGAAPPVS